MPISLDTNYRKVFLGTVSNLGGNQELAKKYLDWMSYLKNVGQDALEKQYPGEKIHGHHALPKYIFKEYEKDPGVMVYIPVSVHYEAHRMLVEIFPKGSKERKAMIVSCMGDVKYRMSNGLQVSDEDRGLYDLYKMEIEGQNNPNYGMHWVHLMGEDGTESSSDYYKYISTELKISLDNAKKLGSFILNFHTKKTPKAKDDYFEKIFPSTKVSGTQPSTKDGN